MMHSDGPGMLGETGPADIFGWSLALLALLAAGFVVVSYLKKWYAQGTEDLPSAGFTLSDLRELHRQGKMTDAEFAAAKAKVVEAAQRATARQARTQQAAGGKAAPDVGFEQKGPAEGGEPDKNDPVA